MSHLSSVFTSIPVKIQDKSGFDLSYENCFTCKVGDLVPAYIEEVLPADEFSIGSAMQIKLPPMATDFYGKVDARLEFFFVPNRLLWAGWQDFITQDKNHAPLVPGYSVAAEVPQIYFAGTHIQPGSLADYIGIKRLPSESGTTSDTYNALPFLAYHKIVDDYYRDSNNQKPFFVDGVSYGSTNNEVMYAPYYRPSASWSSSASGYCGTSISSLRKRCWAKDYFTTATVKPQAGAESSLSFTVDSGMTGSFTIASLRAANSLQKWLERNNLGGTRYYDQITAHFGVTPKDATMQRPVLLGVQTIPIIQNSVMQTAPQNADDVSTNNPFGSSVGAGYGKSIAFGKGSNVDKFVATEHGFIIGMFSIVPHANYSTGTRRLLKHHLKSTDYAWPEFANIGDQEIYTDELCSTTAGTIFGYNQRYSEYKYHDDETHGLFRNGCSLDSFVLQRAFEGGTGDVPELGSDFLEIPSDAMDDVSAVSNSVSSYGAMVDIAYSVQALRTLPEYSLPSL